jgi:hypothetical protein
MSRTHHGVGWSMAKIIEIKKNTNKFQQVASSLVNLNVRITTAELYSAINFFLANHMSSFP